MSRQAIKAVDAYCEACNWDNAIANCFPDERESWGKKRDKALAKLRRALARTTKEEFLKGRWRGAPMSKREAQWEAMQARASSGREPPKVPTFTGDGLTWQTAWQDFPGSDLDRARRAAAEAKRNEEVAPLGSATGRDQS